MPTQTTDPFLLEDLEEAGTTSELASDDLDGLRAVGPFYEGNSGTAIYNSSFRPFQAPVPFLFARHGVVSDWKFFLDDEDWLSLWGRRFGKAAILALAEELRGLPWRAPPHSERRRAG